MCVNASISRTCFARARARSSPTLAEGVLTKRALRSKRNWKLRWFVLQGTLEGEGAGATELRYYKTAQDARPKGTLDLSGPVRVRAVEAPRPLCIVVTKVCVKLLFNGLGVLVRTAHLTQVVRNSSISFEIQI